MFGLYDKFVILDFAYFMMDQILTAVIQASASIISAFIIARSAARRKGRPRKKG